MCNGADIKALTALLYGQGVQSAERIVELIKAISGDILEVSLGTVFGWLEALHQRAEVEKEKIENHLLDFAAGMHGRDYSEHGRTSGICSQFQQSALGVLYVPMERKNIEALAKDSVHEEIRGHPDA